MIQKRVLDIIQIKNLKEENIFGIIGRMEMLLKYFERHKKLHSQIPFLKVYYLVTKKVFEKNLEKKDYYNYPEKMDELDVHFCNLYFDALKPFLDSEKKKTPWKNYYSYCSSGKDFPFLEVLLGINSHINADLCDVLAKLNYQEKRDFMKINKILLEVIPDMIRYLFFEEKDFLGLGGLIIPDLVEKEFKKTVVKWRKDAWKNSKKLKKNPRLKKDLYIQTENLSKELIQIFENDLPLHPKRFLKRINKLKVKI